MQIVDESPTPTEMKLPSESPLPTEMKLSIKINTGIENQLKESNLERRVRYAKQFMIVFIAAIVSSASGMIQLWPNVLASHIALTNTTISGYEVELAPWQMDLVGSIAHVGSIVGFLISGYPVSRVGRKWSLVITALPGIAGSTMITVAINTHMIIVGRFLEGITNGMMNVAVFIYASEIGDTKIRGSISMLVFLMVQSGGIATISLGTALTWYYMSLICCCVLLAHCLLAGPIMNESPSFLAIRHRYEEALKILRSLRGPDADIHEELAYVQKQNQGSGSQQGYMDLLQMQYLKKIGIMCVIFFIHNFCGTQVLRVNATRILRAFGSQLDEKVMAILIIGVLLFANTFMTAILDWYGRRRCIMTSLIIITLAYTALGAYIHLLNNQPSLFEGDHNTLLEAVQNTSDANDYLIITGGGNNLMKENSINMTNAWSHFNHPQGGNDTSLVNAFAIINTSAITNSSTAGKNASAMQTTNFTQSFNGNELNNWLPLLLLTIASFGHGMGIGPLVFVLSPEMFPTTLRSQGTSICTMIGSLQTFAILQLYSVIQDSLTQAGLFWLFSTVSALGVIFVYFFLKETTGNRVTCRSGDKATHHPSLAPASTNDFYSHLLPPIGRSFATTTTDSGQPQ
ncbi:facilitated trehalose transporter Tret1-like [Palaemon carinicauda]|uniref:facilitated trehalose transporter Tret1-like n=1 Tax=Palaemon carinicauda TaxID=392227 RepID=UPI0035B59B6D